MKKILVTGASGFCGRHLCRYLAQERSVKILGTYNHQLITPSIPGLDESKLNLQDRKQVQHLVRTFRPHQIYHLAGQSSTRLSWVDPEATVRTNAAGTLYLLEAMRQYAPASRLLLASSAQVYGRGFMTHRRIRESDGVWPNSPYGFSKLIAEYAALNYCAAFGADVVIARAFNHIGEGQSQEYALSDWARQIASIERGRQAASISVGNIRVRREMLDVADVVRAYRVIMERGQKGRVYNVATGRSRALKSYLTYLINRSRLPIQVKVNASKFRRNDLAEMSGNAARLRSLGWRSHHTELKAADKLLAYWRERIK